MVWLALALFCLIQGLIPGDELKTLPGWAGPLPSRQYSGYIDFHTNCDDAYHMHYWLIESEGNPSKDPLVLWLNGGPGSSSMIGLFTENLGPFKVTSDSLKTSPPTLFPNNYSWTKVANVLFLELPNGVGFSYCDGGCPFWDDMTSAENNWLALCYFFRAYPEFAANELYLAGESYAGVYIPTLMSQIQNGSCPFARVNLKGAAIGNGCTGTQVGPCSSSRTGQTIKFLQSHGFVSETLSNQVNEACADSSDWASPNKRCLGLLLEFSAAAGTYFKYNAYDTCGPPTTTFLDQACGFGLEWACKYAGQEYSQFILEDEEIKVGSPLWECGGQQAMTKYLNDPGVQKALHVQPTQWPGTVVYNRSVPDLISVIPELLADYRILIYSGDFDTQIPASGSQEWTEGLNYPVKTAWRPWKIAGGAVSGYVTEYQVPNNSFAFLTVRGAGHMVPQYRPEESLYFITKFLKQQPY